MCLRHLTVGVRMPVRQSTTIRAMPAQSRSHIITAKHHTRPRTCVHNCTYRQTCVCSFFYAHHITASCGGQPAQAEPSTVGDYCSDWYSAVATHSHHAQRQMFVLMNNMPWLWCVPLTLDPHNTAPADTCNACYDTHPLPAVRQAANAHHRTLSRLGLDLTCLGRPLLLAHMTTPCRCDAPSLVISV